MARARRGEELSIDLIALPLLFCLLCAVVGLIALSENPDEPAPAAPDRKVEQLQHLVTAAQRLLREQEAAVRTGRVTVAERETQDAANTVQELNTKISLAQKVHKAEAALLVLKERVKTKHQAQPPAQPPQLPADASFNTYAGDYVLLECKKDHAVVHPGEWSISSTPSDADFKRLMSQIRKAGFVAIAVRPEGWYVNSFDKLRALITKELGQSTAIGRAEFPIKDNEPITPYLPAPR